MKVLVTGGAGFIGSHIVDALLENGHDVVVVDDLSTGKRANVNTRARLYQVDIRDEQALDAVLAQEKPEAISHQAAKANVRESMVRPQLYAEVNILGSLNLLELARRHGVRKVIYASTGGAVYGEPEYLPADEQHPINPLDPYGASKHQVEHYLYIYRKHFGIDYTVLRYPNVYGPRQDPDGEAGVIAIWTALMLKGQPTVVHGSGEQQRDFVYVGDIARANVLALERGGGEIINLGSAIGTSINEVFDLLQETTGYGLKREHGPAKQGEVFRSYITREKAESILGWRPTVSLAEGLEQTVAYFRS
ncbi:MAG: SDR family NAD(P)-dependent oxidoreductase [Chloroflexi bacterium]|nr:SDR family NAD(P)-dependent oxidoreductase [Chloroflexota bacterium]